MNKAINEFAFETGDKPDFVHPEKRNWLESGDDELNQILPDLSDEEQSYLEQITSDNYQDLIDRIEHYTGIEADNLSFPSMYSLVLQALQETQRIESEHKDFLENLAVESILGFPEFEMVKDAVEKGDITIDAKLAKAELHPQDDEESKDDNSSPSSSGGLSQVEDLNAEYADAFMDIDEQRLRRRLANMLIQGQAVLKFYLFNLVKEDLDKINDKLINYYGILSTVAQIGYWALPKGFEEVAQDNEGAQMGSSQVKPDGESYVIKVRALTFPYLIHELVKGIYEWVSLDPNVEGAREEDSITKETEDLIVGPELVKRILNQIDIDKQELIPLVQKQILQMPIDSVKKVLKGGSEGDAIMDEVVAHAEEMWQEYKSEPEEEEEDWKPDTEEDIDND